MRSKVFLIVWECCGCVLSVCMGEDAGAGAGVRVGVCMGVWKYWYCLGSENVSVRVWERKIFSV